MLDRLQPYKAAKPIELIRRDGDRTHAVSVTREGKGEQSAIDRGASFSAVSHAYTLTEDFSAQYVVPVAAGTGWFSTPSVNGSRR